MKVLRFLRRGRPAWGVLEGNRVRLLAAPPFRGIRPSPETFPLEGLPLLPPVVPGKIIGLGLNYREHAQEFSQPVPREPVIFLKAPSSLLGPGGAILLPAGAGKVDHEAELALVVGRRCRRLREEEAAGALLGVTCINDVTARDLQREDVQWTRAKSFDTFSPLGPWVETEDPLATRTVECLVNGELRQRSSTASLVRGIPEILAFVSVIMTLEPGDVIATGTPPGVGPLRAGDRVEVRVSGIGTLENRVADEGRHATTH
jgi:2-keto-4-pentenoate hydratase/2-oxohepta-3-ene-1,7-dioic acid hydratase in catechol pathway